MRRAVPVIAVALAVVVVVAGYPALDADSGDGCELVVAANRGGDGDTEIALYDGGTVRSLTPGSVAAGASFSPDGERVVFVLGDSGWADAGPITTDLRIAAVDEPHVEHRSVLDGAGLRYDPAWSPAGGAIAYVEQAGNDRVLRLVAPDGTGDRLALHVEGAELVAPAWSSDGETLAFIERHFQGSRYTYDIGTLALGTGDIRRVASVPDASTISWMPDGRSLLVSTYAGEDGTIAILDVESGRLTTVAEHATKAVVADDGTIVYLDRVRQGIWRLAVGHLDDERLEFERHIGTDEVYNYGHFGVDVAPCGR